MNIYTPRDMIFILQQDAIRASRGQAPEVRNPQICTKIEFRGYEISVAMDSSHTNDDLFRSEIRVYDLATQVDVTAKFLRSDQTFLTSSEDLFELMQQVNREIDSDACRRDPTHLVTALKLYDPKVGAVQAIQRYRQLSGCGLREAAEIVRHAIKARGLT